ncbi:hypothetical protein CEAn_00098 [Coxiella endosymbiont of Amblyomma nuttalli]|nr:hypothetical protein CEAn_00098 [Coxiella endosymbiont of Amblyomma nuttalli]
MVRYQMISNPVCSREAPLILNIRTTTMDVALLGLAISEEKIQVVLDNKIQTKLSLRFRIVSNATK